MLIFKSHRSQLHKTNIALAALTYLYVVGAAVALSSPYWVSSTSILAPLAVFADTLLGMSVLAFVAVALVSLAIYSIMKNNNISKLEAPKLIVSSDQKSLVLQITEKDLEFIEENYKNENGQYIIHFTNSKGEVFTTTSDGQVKYNKQTNPILLGNIKLFGTSNLEKKKCDGTFEKIDHEQGLKTLGLGIEKNDYKGLTIRFIPNLTNSRSVPHSILKAPEVEQEEQEQSLS